MFACCGFQKSDRVPTARFGRVTTRRPSPGQKQPFPIWRLQSQPGISATLPTQTSTIVNNQKVNLGLCSPLSAYKYTERWQ